MKIKSRRRKIYKSIEPECREGRAESKRIAGMFVIVSEAHGSFLEGVDKEKVAS